MNLSNINSGRNCWFSTCCIACRIPYGFSIFSISSRFLICQQWWYHCFPKAQALMRGGSLSLSLSILVSPLQMHLSAMCSSGRKTNMSTTSTPEQRNLFITVLNWLILFLKSIWIFACILNGLSWLSNWGSLQCSALSNTWPKPFTDISP